VAGSSAPLHAAGVAVGIVLSGTDTTGLGRKELARLRGVLIGSVSEFHHLLPELTVVESMLVPRRIAGEPTGNLDTTTSDVVHQRFRDIKRELGTACLIVTHDRAVAERTPRILVGLCQTRCRPEISRATVR